MFSMPNVVSKAPAPEPDVMLKLIRPVRYLSVALGPGPGGELGDHPRRDGANYYPGEGEAVEWRDVGWDEVASLWYVETGGSLQNQPPPCCVDTIHMYWREAGQRRRSSEESVVVEDPGRFGYTLSPSDSDCSDSGSQADTPGSR